MRNAGTLLPSAVVIARHGQYPTNLLTNATGEAAMLVKLPSPEEDARIGLDTTGTRQAGCLGGHILGLFPEGIALCASSDFQRVIDTADIALPGVQRIVTSTLRERDRGAIARIPKPQFEALYPEEFLKKTADPRGWLPPNGERLTDKAADLENLLSILGRIATDKPVAIFTSGEVLIAARTSEILGNMDNAKLREGLGPDWPALSVDNADFDVYTRRDPRTGELGPSFVHMMMARGGGEELVHTGWISINR